MPSTEYELKPVTRITTHTVGEPGKRVFYLQGRSAEMMLTLIIEKQQIQSLAVGVEQFLQDLDERYPELSEDSDTLTEIDM